MGKKRTIGMWMYKNSGGDAIAKKIIKRLKERNIETINDINLRHAVAKRWVISILIGKKFGLRLRNLFFFLNKLAWVKARNPIIPGVLIPSLFTGAQLGLEGLIPPNY